jgi:hypothetical protein
MVAILRGKVALFGSIVKLMIVARNFRACDPKIRRALKEPKPPDLGIARQRQNLPMPA